MNLYTHLLSVCLAGIVDGIGTDFSIINLKKAGNLPEAVYLADIIRAMEGKVKWKMENDKVIITENR